MDGKITKQFMLIIVCPFVLFLLTIVLSVLLQYSDFNCSFGIFKLFLCFFPHCASEERTIVIVQKLNCLINYYVWSWDQHSLSCHFISNNGIQCTWCVWYNKRNIAILCLKCLKCIVFVRQIKISFLYMLLNAQYYCMFRCYLV